MDGRPGVPAERAGSQVCREGRELDADLRSIRNVQGICAIRIGDIRPDYRACIIICCRRHPLHRKIAGPAQSIIVVIGKDSAGDRVRVCACKIQLSAIILLHDRTTRTARQGIANAQDPGPLSILPLERIQQFERACVSIIKRRDGGIGVIIIERVNARVIKKDIITFICVRAGKRRRTKPAA